MSSIGKQMFRVKKFGKKRSIEVIVLFSERDTIPEGFSKIFAKEDIPANDYFMKLTTEEKELLLQDSKFLDVYNYDILLKDCPSFLFVKAYN